MNSFLEGTPKTLSLAAVEAMNCGDGRRWRERSAQDEAMII